MRRNVIAGILVALAATIGVNSAQAEPSATRLQVQARSAQRGLEAARVPVLQRKPGPGNKEVSQQAVQLLVSRLGISASHSEEAEGEKLLLKGSDWMIEVSDGGNALRFRGRTSEFTLPAKSKPTAKEIEASARAFIRDTVPGLIELGTGEELVFLGTRYGYSAGQAASSQQPDPSELTEWVAIFGRKVGSELVVGGGSIVAILYNADGTVQGFDRDWPEYEVTSVQAEMAGVAATRSRRKKLEPGAAGATTSESRVECGYFDPGGRKRSKQRVIQPACMYSMVTASAALHNGVVYAVPAATKPIKATAWPELDAVCLNEACGTSP